MYKWLKDGVPVDDFTTSQFFRFQNIRPEDTGSYKCIAQNDAGTIFSEKIDVVVAREFGFQSIVCRVCLHQMKWDLINEHEHCD